MALVGLPNLQASTESTAKGSIQASTESTAKGSILPQTSKLIHQGISCSILWLWPGKSHIWWLAHVSFELQFQFHAAKGSIFMTSLCLILISILISFLQHKKFVILQIVLMFINLYANVQVLLMFVFPLPPYLPSFVSYFLLDKGQLLECAHSTQMPNLWGQASFQMIQQEGFSTISTFISEA